METGRSADDAQGQPVEAGNAVNDDVLRLYAEDVVVTKEDVETGRVRITTITKEREHVVDEALSRVNVEVSHVAIGRPVEAVPEVRHEGAVMIIPVVEEVLVLQRQLVLREEIHIRRIHTTEQHQERVTLRHQEAIVTRLPPKTTGLEQDQRPRKEASPGGGD